MPASFDAVARELTVEAARRAGLGAVTLLEEPQAALYAWVDAMGDAWRTAGEAGRRGAGGATWAAAPPTSRSSRWSRAAATSASSGWRWATTSCSAATTWTSPSRTRWPTRSRAGGAPSIAGSSLALTHGAREAKEALFANPSLVEVPVAIPGRGSSLVGGALRTALSRVELEATLVDGFFPQVELGARPAAARRAGLTTLGLPYASDPAVTRHLAAFLARHRALLGQGSAAAVPLAGEAFLHPTAVLFNGGVMKAGPLAGRVIEVLSSWLAAEGAPPPRVLPAGDLDLAVARGAAAYGRVRAGHGIRIRGGTSRAYYVGVEASMPAVPGLPTPVRAVCLAPMGMEEGTSAELPGEEVGLVVGEPVEFRLFSSSVRREDGSGAVVEDAEELEEGPPVTATIAPGTRPAGEVVPVRLRAHVTEIGTLELECVGKDESWSLEWSLRGQGSDAAEQLPES